MRRPVKSAMAKVAIGLVGLVIVGCRSAEPFSLSLEGGIAISQGSGGFPGGTGGDIIVVPGSGGADGSGGTPVVVDAEPPVEVSTDTPGVVDAAVDRRRDASPPGPFTLFNCYALKSYVLDAPYNAADRVFSLRDLRVFQCRPWPNSGWCSIGAYEPDGPLGFWPDAWTPLGYCE